ncbi:MAG: YezD family protein [Candidatus Omnitrophica bacterium]|nr:YezD family protein [Candidatus Omnitrophota bacterium]
MGPDRKMLEQIADCLRQISYGEVVITVHDSRITQIEKRQKMRFDTQKQPHKQG